MDTLVGCLVQVGNGIELEAVGLQFKPYQWLPCGVTWDSSRTVMVIKLLRTSALLRLRQQVCDIIINLLYCSDALMLHKLILHA